MRIRLLVLCSALAPAAPARAGAPLPDRGIFPDLGARIEVTLPERLDRDALRATYDPGRRLVVLYDGEHPLKAYGLGGAGAPAPPAGGSVDLGQLLPLMDPGEAAELRARAPATLPVTVIAAGAAITASVAPATLAPAGGIVRAGGARAPVHAPAAPDSDGDGIPDRLDLLLGARKLVANGAAYTEGYFRIAYPGGDVPREIGVCSDTIVRAFRNAGFDLQKLVAEDVRRAPAAYPQVKRPDPNIDHRRVKTLLRWFERHVARVPRQEPWRPGDVVFMDTFPSRPGPDHVGIVSDRRGPSRLPLVINNWTVGTVEGEMDLLPAIPVTHRFRLP